jgi:hypothetical protein
LARWAFVKDWPPMHFCFYPKHEFGCPHVNHCPHLGGASLGSLVYAADEQTEWTDSLLRQVDGLREENAAKGHKIEKQAGRIEQRERELKAERQKQFKAKKVEPVEVESSIMSLQPKPPSLTKHTAAPNWSAHCMQWILKRYAPQALAAIFSRLRDPCFRLPRSFIRVVA